MLVCVEPVVGMFESLTSRLGEIFDRLWPHAGRPLHQRLEHDGRDRAAGPLQGRLEPAERGRVEKVLAVGLPMAVLQVKRNLETAIAFHWFIDFARFLFGY